jgi:hypothetical protein
MEYHILVKVNSIILSEKCTSVTDNLVHLPGSLINNATNKANSYKFSNACKTRGLIPHKPRCYSVCPCFCVVVRVCVRVLSVFRARHAQHANARVTIVMLVKNRLQHTCALVNKRVNVNEYETRCNVTHYHWCKTSSYITFIAQTFRLKTRSMIIILVTELFSEKVILFRSPWLYPLVMVNHHGQLYDQLTISLSWWIS